MIMNSHRTEVACRETLLFPSETFIRGQRVVVCSLPHELS